MKLTQAVCLAAALALAGAVAYGQTHPQVDAPPATCNDPSTYDHCMGYAPDPNICDAQCKARFDAAYPEVSKLRELSEVCSITHSDVQCSVFARALLGQSPSTIIAFIGRPPDGNMNIQNESIWWWSQSFGLMFSNGVVTEVLPYVQPRTYTDRVFQSTKTERWMTFLNQTSQVMNGITDARNAQQQAAAPATPNRTAKDKKDKKEEKK